MIRATCLGHAALLIESDAARLLVDPILGKAISGGGNIIDPPRQIDHSALTNLDRIIISHHHSDHFSLSDLDLIPNAREQHFVIPPDKKMRSSLLDWGADQVSFLQAGAATEVNDLTVTATPSEVPFPEMGILIEQGDIRFLNLVDSVFHPRMDELRVLLGGSPAVVLAPFQAGGYMSFLPLRRLGPPVGLESAIRQWSNEYLDEIAADIAVLDPELTVAFADGLAYEDVGVNARHFPLPDSAFIEKLESQGQRALSAIPGLVIVASGAGVQVEQTPSSLVEVDYELRKDRRFDLSVPLNDIPLSWFELPAEGLGQLLPGDWKQRVIDAISDRFVQRRSSEYDDQMALRLQQWHLHMLGEGGDLIVWCDWKKGANPRLRHGAVVPEDRKYGMLCHGTDILEVVEGRLGIEAITLGGLFRYESREEDHELEALRGRVLEPFTWLLDH